MRTKRIAVLIEITPKERPWVHTRSRENDNGNFVTTKVKDRCGRMTRLIIDSSERGRLGGRGGGREAGVTGKCTTKVLRLTSYVVALRGPE